MKHIDERTTEKVTRMANTVLIIDDNAKICRSLSRNLEQYGYKNYIANSGREAIELASTKRPDIVILDVVLGNESGLDILARLKSVDDRTPVLMITGFASIETAVWAIKNGAYDYLQKPLDLNKLMKTMENAIKIAELNDENQGLKKRLEKFTGRIITVDQPMMELCETAKKLAATDLPILLLGENGTGKEVIADYIHFHSERNSKEFHKINCASFPESLLDNELFGHEKGSFTGADSVFKGVFERADKSTLFLDEIGDMSLSIQAKILRTIQNSEIRRIGGSQNIDIDVRFIAATNKDLEQMITRGEFREDLYYRLNIAMLKIPSLRDRSEDIIPLAEYFLQEINKQRGASSLRFTDEVRGVFRRYGWPGNVRELKNAVHYATAIASSEEITAANLPNSILRELGRSWQSASVTSNIREETERGLIIRALQSANGNKSEAAKTLCMSRKTLYDKLRKYAITND
jgi:DNA-binding NtrC family response regulator